MTTPGWPTPRSSPTRREPPARPSSSAPPPPSPPTASPASSEVITDNHLSYKLSHDVRDAVAALGAQHLFIKPLCPWQNGKVERFNRTLAIEWAYRQPFTSNAARSSRPCALARALQHCTDATPHSEDSHPSAGYQPDGVS